MDYARKKYIAKMDSIWCTDGTTIQPRVTPESIVRKMANVDHTLRNDCKLIRYWIEINGSDPPATILDDYSSITLLDKVMLAHTWVKYVNTDPPEWMRHDPNLVVNDTAIAFVWVKNVGTDPPVWMRCDPNLIINGRTITNVWMMENKTDPPEWIFGTNLDHRSMRCDPNLRD
jgi:hypothetical protein